MGFLYNDAKREAAAAPKKPAAPRGHVPIASLNQAGCSVCPRDRAPIGMPKPGHAGSDLPLIYMLSNAPTHEEDGRRELWSGIAGREIRRKMRAADADVRYGNIVECASGVPDDASVGVREIECCRGRAVADIERSRPVVVVGVGDEVLHWATGLPRNAPAFRGTFIATRIGRHDCWFYPVMYPNYTARRSGRRSEYELAMEHDLAVVERAVLDDMLDPPVVRQAPYDAGIVQITGQEPGDMQRLEEELHRMARLPAVAIDLETSALDPHEQHDPRVWTAAVGTFERTVAFAVDHRDGWGTDTRMRRVRGLLGEFLAQSGRKRAHNAAFEMGWSERLYGPRVLRLTEWDDTMAMAHTLDERKGTKSLDFQCRARFGFFLKDQSPVDPSIKGWIDQFSLRQVLRYNGIDTKWTDLLADDLLPRLAAEPSLMAAYEARMRHAPTLVLTTAAGLPMDREYARAQVASIGARIADIEARLRATPEVRAYSQRHGAFSPTNPDHVLALMRDVLKRPEVRRESWDGTVKWTTDEEALEAIPRDEAPSAKLVLEHRGLTRNETTYLRPLLDGRLTGADGRNHSEYGQLHTVTGRINSPMHNWPKRKFREVRGVVAPRPGEWVVPADYGQIEFRVAGMLSEDRNLVKYCWTGYDVHRYWAERAVKEYPRIKDWIVAEFEVDWDEKGIKTLRQEMKNGWVFPQLFGSTVQSCATRLHLPVEVADDLAAEFWDEFRGVKKWQERTVASYEKNLYVETLGGVRRRGPTTVNELINMPIQGTACEIVLAGMDAISERAEIEENPELQPAFNGHDDLTFFMSDARLEANVRAVAEEMCRPRFDYVIVPLVVEVSVGPRWDKCEEVAKFSSADLYSLDNPYR